jgi:crossover junction endodeoxyribonuclease RusA
MDTKCKTLKLSYQKQVRAQYSHLPLKAPLRAVLSLWHGTRRVTDIDNFNKLVLDSLTGLVYEDDSQIVELTITKGYDKERPRVEVIIDTP